jgi:hypothetical protein
MNTVGYSVSLSSAYVTHLVQSKKKSLADKECKIYGILMLI